MVDRRINQLTGLPVTIQTSLTSLTISYHHRESRKTHHSDLFNTLSMIMRTFSSFSLLVILSQILSCVAKSVDSDIRFPSVRSDDLQSRSTTFNSTLDAEYKAKLASRQAKAGIKPKRAATGNIVAAVPHEKDNSRRAVAGMLSCPVRVLGRELIRSDSCIDSRSCFVLFVCH
jgi:hypothetical protein